MTPRAPNRNTLWATVLVDELVRSGLTEVSLAPGSRSTPLVLAAAARPELRIRVHVDERSAAFFALGLGKVTGRPAAVVTTSGTATANLYPAVVEASQGETPLLLLTADRPHRLRGADANQAIDQLRLFGPFVRAFHDVDPPGADAGALRHLRAVAGRAVADAVGLPAGPVHLNLPFDKPLEPTPVAGDVPGDLEERVPSRVLRGPGGGGPTTWTTPRRPAASGEELARLMELLDGAERAVLVAGPHPEPGPLGEAVVRLAAATGIPLLADPLSGARFRPDGGAVVLGAYDLFLRSAGARARLAPDLVIRVGQTPTSASLARWLADHEGVDQVVVDTGHRWKDHLGVATGYVRADPVGTLREMAGRVRRTPGAPWRRLWEAAETAAAMAAARAFGGRDVFEGEIAARVVGALPEDAPLFLSSSMPVRDVDAFARPGRTRLRVFGNRGASGIDGIVSTGLGVAAGAGAPGVVLLGDLAFLHDMNGLLAAREVEPGVVFVVIHNDGGGIFHLLPVREHEPEFTRLIATPHGLDLAHAAALYGIPYTRVDDAGAFPGTLAEAMAGVEEGGGSRIVEVRSDREANEVRRRELMDEVDGAVAAALEEPADIITRDAGDRTTNGTNGKE